MGEERDQTMDEFSARLNDLIVDTYRSVLKVEESMLKNSHGIDLSISEIHMLEAVGRGEGHRRTISGLAEDLDITLPSVTVAINKLLKKGGRTVYVSLTRKGKKMDSVHRYFHENMVRSIISGMTEEEKQALYCGIQKLDAFLKRKIGTTEAD